MNTLKKVFALLWNLNSLIGKWVYYMVDYRCLYPHEDSCFYFVTEYEVNGVLDNSGGEEDTDSWEQVGPKKKSVLTRKVCLVYTI